MLKLRFSHLLCPAGPIYAESGAEALAKAATHSFDLILMDIHMPDPAGPDGLTCTQMIRSGLTAGPASEANRYARIVALTTECSPDHWLTYREAQLDGMIPKPIRVSHLRPLLETLHTEHESWGLPITSKAGTPPKTTFGSLESTSLPDSGHVNPIFFSMSAAPGRSPPSPPPSLVSAQLPTQCQHHLPPRNRSCDLGSALTRRRPDAPVRGLPVKVDWRKAAGGRLSPARTAAAVLATHCNSLGGEEYSTPTHALSRSRNSSASSAAAVSTASPLPVRGRRPSRTSPDEPWPVRA